MVSLSALVCADCNAEPTEETMAAVIAASGNTVGAQWAPVFAATLKKIGGVDSFCPAPGSGNRECFVRGEGGLGVFRVGSGTTVHSKQSGRDRK